MSADHITYEELLAEMERLHCQPDDEGMTTTEWCETLGKPRSTVIKTLKELQKVGRVRVGRKMQTALDGGRRSVPCYTLLPAKKTAKRKAAKRATPKRKRARRK
jgi:predicted transcriptional regulator